MLVMPPSIFVIFLLGDGVMVVACAPVRGVFSRGRSLLFVVYSFLFICSDMYSIIIIINDTTLEPICLLSSFGLWVVDADVPEYSSSGCS